MRPFGVYVHVPFCASRCDYCAFATWTDRHHLRTAYVDACVRELHDASLPVATSVFVGGGTPSQLDDGDLVRLLDAVPRAAGAEVTVECNPEDAALERFRRWRAAGVSRISFGVQSMVPHVLASLGRRHDPASVARAVDAARQAGFASFNLDLIHGAAGESVDDWRTTLDRVLALEPPHVSAYALTIEPGTPLARDTARHPDDDDQAAKYELAEERLEGAGLRWYELSNWARPGHECRHNVLYWAQGDYRGVGCAAHSHRRGRRWWNVRTPERYVESIAARRPPTAGEDVLDGAGRAREALELALRTRAGVPVAALDLADPDLDGLVDVDRGRAVLTVAGRLLANEVAHRLRVTPRAAAPSRSPA